MPPADTAPQDAPDATAQVADAAPDAAEAAAPAEEPKGRGFLDRLFGRNERKETAGPASDEAPPDEETPKPPDPSEDKLVLTQDELDRKVQAEADRRDSAREKKAREQREREEHRRLRDEDPYAYAERERQREAEESVHRQAVEASTEWTQVAVRSFDEGVVKPLLEQLSDAERTALLADPEKIAGVGGRLHLIEGVIARREKDAHARGAKEAEEKLRGSDTFRRQLLAQMRGTDEHEEPELITSGGAARRNGNTSSDANAALRQLLGGGDS